MARDPLRTVLEVRRRQVDQARRILGECLGAESEFFHAIRRLDDAAARIHEEFEGESMGGPTPIGVLEHLNARYEAGKKRRDGLLVQWATAHSRTEQARAALGASRLEAKAVEQLIEERETARQQEREKREQHELDDIARALRARFHEV